MCLVVGGSASVSFVAGSSIVLGPGFQATAGSALITFQTGVGAGGSGGGIPAAVTLLSPAYQAVRQSTTPTLSWQGVPGATSYTLYLDTVNPPLQSYAVSGTSFTPGAALQGGQLYYWYVLANSGLLTGPASTTWNFWVTGAPSNVSVSPASGGPPAGGLGTPTNFTFSFSSPNGWQDITWTELEFNYYNVGSDACFLGFWPGPVPDITAISPQSVTQADANDNSIIYGVYGTNLVSSNASGVVFVDANGNPDPTITFTVTQQDDPLIQGTIALSSKVQAGNHTFYVASPNGNSNTLTFGVQGDLTPSIDTVSPAALTAGQPVTVTINGSNFGPACDTNGTPCQTAALNVCAVGATPPCSTSDITVTSINWSDTQITATFTANVSAGAYGVAIGSAGMTGQGFCASGEQGQIQQHVAADSGGRRPESPTDRDQPNQRRNRLHIDRAGR